ncbi:hypothetical protein Sgly_0114 [Syntrophobotulus glycolicus DSM 8271]|uniref:Uncharacterized protein n=1 Tax=Syntrophobotulus glycolicus (strain DSM 8271 / FlGlyR) TaxID=645991 RepID=F0SVK9_SYNGF|nr:hypothetical protein [Syntrophobotulus glycolicus]ADY54485.1 hypothetical protein Sgly_0114 [Syntrophobotulus glycolicus DSM 8271]
MDRNRKLWLKYAGYLAIIILFVFIHIDIVSRISDPSKEYDTANMNFRIMVIIFLNVLFGAIIGLETFISELNKRGAWKCNIPKLVLLGAPLLYVCIGYALFYTFNHSAVFFTGPLSLLSLTVPNYNFSSMLQFLQIFLGYTIITSFHKADKEATEE